MRFYYAIMTAKVVECLPQPLRTPRGQNLGRSNYLGKAGEGSPSSPAKPGPTASFTEGWYERPPSQVAAHPFGPGIQDTVRLASVVKSLS